MRATHLVALGILLTSSSLSHAEISGSGHQLLGCTGAIQTFVWHDANRNGIQDAGEMPIRDVALLLQRDGEPELGTDTLITGGNGRVLFFNLCLEDHLLAVDPTTLPSGMQPTIVNVASAQRDVFDSDGSGDFDAVVIYLDEQHISEESVDFGFARPVCDGSIGDRVWLDEDSDGIQSTFESGLANIEMQLTRIDDDATQVATTSRDGRYGFDGLCQGTYVVAPISVPSAFSPSPALSGADEEQDSQPTGALVMLDGQDDSIDFGLFRSGCRSALNGRIFLDTNANGIRDIAEQGLGGVDVFMETDAGYTQFARTSGDGEYQLRGLCAGSYNVQIDQDTLPADSVLTTQGQLQPATIDSNDSQVELADTGFTTQCAGRIGDRVWLDQDSDGVQDDGEFGLADVVVVLRDALGNERGRESTDNDGGYQFTALCAGDYAVQVDASRLDDGFAPSPVGVGDSGTDSDGAAPVWVTLESMIEQDLSVDFGYTAAGSALRLDTQCHALSFESAEFECKKPISSLSMIWGGTSAVNITAYLGDGNDEILAQIDNVAPGARATVSGYEEAPKNVLWRVHDAQSGALVGDSWFELSCDDKAMDGPEDCGTPQGDGRDGEMCDDDCLTQWRLDGVIDKERRLQCTSDDVVSGTECTVAKDTLLYLEHTLTNAGGGTASAVTIEANHDIGQPAAMVIDSGTSVTFGAVVPIEASRQFSVTGRCEQGDGCDVSRATTVTAQPKPACAVVAQARLEKDDDKVKWKLVNVGSEDALIERVVVTWPESHEGIKEIKRAGDKIMDLETHGRGASFGPGQLEPKADKRRIKKDKAEHVELKFLNKSYDHVDSDYSITVHFEQGCSVSLED